MRARLADCAVKIEIMALCHMGQSVPAIGLRLALYEELEVQRKAREAN